MVYEIYWSNLIGRVHDKYRAGHFAVVAPHHDLKAGDTVITSPEPGWRDDGLYVIRLMGDDGEVPRVASQIK